MPLVRQCSYEPCTVLTMGEYCLEHEREIEALDAPLTSEATEVRPRLDRADNRLNQPVPAGSTRLR